MPLPILLFALAAPPTATAARCTTPPAIDGALGEPAWAAAQWSTGFVLAGNDVQPGPAAVQTRFKVLYDDQAAYVAVECDEPAIDQLKAVTPWRDGAVWQDDCVEIFFDPAGEGRYYHHLLVNARGTIYDDYNADYGMVHSKLWNGDYRAAGRIDAAARKWSIEVALPYGALVLPASAGATWKFNVTRERQAAGATELTTWAPLRGNFHQPKLFGTLTGLPTDYRAFRWTLGEPQVDVNRSGSGWATLTLRLPAKNETGAAQRVTASAEVLDQPGQKVQAEPVELAAGAEQTLKLPDLRVRGATEANLIFALRDPAGKLLKAVVKGLATDTKPLSIRLLRPCYRNNIYAGEALREIVFEAQMSAGVRQATAKVAFLLSDAAGKPLARGTAVVAATAKPLSLAAANLAIGTYTLSLTALGAGGKEVATATAPVRKLPPPDRGDEVRIDEHRRILVNGKPVFNIGWYGGIPDADPRPDVVALQDLMTPDVIYPPKSESIGERFRAHGVRTVASVENGRYLYAFNLWQQGKEELRKVCDEWHALTEPSDDMRRLTKEMVDCVRGEPGLLGYYIADEPEIHDVQSAYLENYYKLLCELDPYHPVVVTNDTIDGIVTHGCKCADILNPDPYNSDWDYVPNFLKKVNEVGAVGKAIQVTLWHSASDTHMTQDYGTGRPYPYRVFRNQYLASVAYGAMGFTAYTSAFFMPEPEYRYGLPHVWRELRVLEPAIVAPPPAATVTV
ncbi:MAG: hypothetical protein HYU66_19490, partial [Armatimonadetes bacterium]|nr:hypothetical protein [Armatimonadota bacterium]